MEETAPKREMFSLSSTPFTGEQQGAAAGTVAPRAEVEHIESPEHVAPVYFQPSEDQEGSTPAPSAAPSGQGRPPIQCQYCGAMNEPWIVNCRNCRRPLTHTGR